MSSRAVMFPEVRVLDSPTAHEYAGWHGVLYDLRQVERIVERLGSLVASQSDDHDLLYALSASSLVTYARCFKDGLRLGISPTIFDSQADDAAKWHEYFMEARHKHIAHPVNVFDAVVPYCELEENGELKVVGRAVLKRTADSEEGLRMFGVLTRHAIEAVSKTLGPLQVALEAEIRAMTPEQRLSLPPWIVKRTLGDRSDLKALARRKARARARTKARTNSP